MEEQQNIEYSSSMEHITHLIKTHVPYIWVTTYEESRFLKDLFVEVTEKLNFELWTWSAYQGLAKYDPEAPSIRVTKGDMAKTWNPNVALEKIDSYERSQSKRGTVFVMKDFHTCLTQPIPRQMRDIYKSLIIKQKNIIVVSPCLAHGPSGTKPGIEPTLEKQVNVIPYELPNREFIENRIRTSMSNLKVRYKGGEAKLDYTDEEYNTLSMSLQGLTETEIDNATLLSLTHLKKLDEKKLLLEKKQIIQRSEILEYIGQCPDMSDVGGLDAAKAYFDAYSDQFRPEAIEYGVEPLRGVLLTGVPGTGKTLLTQAIADMWKLPLLRLDVGRVMSSLVGSSEEKMRIVIDQVEAIAPTILQIDEIEKSLSGTKSSNFSDGGTLARVFGTLLTAMEERMKGVVILATANDIQALPPELIRRFSETFFIDLPQPSEREEIFRIHLKKRRRQPDKLDISALAKATHEFTGSEIEQAVKEGIARAFRQKLGDVTTEVILEAIKDTKPIAKVMKEKIDAIREWARGRARYASSIAEAAAAPGAQKVTTKNGKELDFSSDLKELDEAVATSKEERQKEYKEAGGEFAHLNNTLDD